MTPYHEQDGVTIYHADALAVLQSLDDSSIDLIATDPPYFKVKNEPWDRQWDKPEQFLAWLDDVLAEFYRVLRPNGSLYLFAYHTLADSVSALVRMRMNVLNTVTWVKPSPGCEINHGAARSGQVSAASLRSYFPRTERIIFAEHYGADGIAKGESGWGQKCDELRGFVFEPLLQYLLGELERSGATRGEIDEYFGTANVSQYWFQRRGFIIPTAERYEGLREALNARANGTGPVLRREYEDLRREYEDLRREYEDLRRPFNVTADVPYTDVWTFPTVSSYPGKHPCEKPLAMMQHIVRSSSREGAVVLDPFMGSGTTLVAAQSLGRSAIGVDMSDKWCNAAVDRLQQKALAL